MLRQQVGGVENGLADTFRGFGIVASDETAVPVQIASGLWTEPGLDHDRRRNSSVVLA